MIPAFSPFLALRYLATRRINLLGVLGVAFAVWAMLVVDGVFTGFVIDIRDNVRRSASPLLLTDLPNDQSYATLREVLESEEGVIAVAPRLRQHAMLQPVRPDRSARVKRGSPQLDFDHTKNGFALLVGIDPLLEPAVVDIDSWLQRGPAEIQRHGREEPESRVFEEPNFDRRSMLMLPNRVEWAARQAAGLAVDEDWHNHESTWPGILLGWRRVFSLPHIQEGDPFDIVVAAFPPNSPGDAAMRTHSKRFASAGWFGSGNRMFDEATVLLPIETVRTMLGHDENDLSSIDIVTDVAIRPRDGLSPAELSSLQRRLEAKVQLILPAGAAACSVLTWQEQNSVYLSAVAQEQIMMQLVLMIVMLVSAFVIYATLHMMVVQKVKDIGIITAVGGSPRGVGSVFLISGSVVGVVGSILGVLAGILSSILLNPVNELLYANFGIELFPRHLFDLQGVPCHIEPSWVVTVALGAIMLAVVVALIPAQKAARMNPVTALSFE